VEEELRMQVECLENEVDKWKAKYNKLKMVLLQNCNITTVSDDEEDVPMPPRRLTRRRSSSLPDGVTLYQHHLLSQPPSPPGHSFIPRSFSHNSFPVIYDHVQDIQSFTSDVEQFEQIHPVEQRIPSPRVPPPLERNALPCISPSHMDRSPSPRMDRTPSPRLERSNQITPFTHFTELSELNHVGHPAIQHAMLQPGLPDHFLNPIEHQQQQQQQQVMIKIEDFDNHQRHRSTSYSQPTLSSSAIAQALGPNVIQPVRRRTSSLQLYPSMLDQKDFEDQEMFDHLQAHSHEMEAAAYMQHAYQEYN